MTGWHDHPTIQTGGRWMASSEYFTNGKPTRPDLTIITEEGSTKCAAEAKRDLLK